MGPTWVATIRRLRRSSRLSLDALQLDALARRQPDALARRQPDALARRQPDALARPRFGLVLPRFAVVVSRLPRQGFC